MEKLLKTLREARPEIIGSIIGGLVVAAVLAVVGKLTSVGIWPVLAIVLGCLWLGCAYLVFKQGGKWRPWALVAMVIIPLLVVVGGIVYYCLHKQPLISIMVDEYPFYVYRDNGAPDNHFSFWGGIMGDGDSIGWGGQIDYGYTAHCHSGSTCMRIAYTPVSPRIYWVGISWQQPTGNYGTINDGFNLKKATRLTFWARGERGGEPVTFSMGGLGRDAKTCRPVPHATYPDSVCPPVEISPTMSATWQQYSMNLVGRDLSHVLMGFMVAISGGDARTIYLDEIRYESEP